MYEGPGNDAEVHRAVCQGRELRSHRRSAWRLQADPHQLEPVAPAPDPDMASLPCPQMENRTSRHAYGPACLIGAASVRLAGLDSPFLHFPRTLVQRTWVCSNKTRPIGEPLRSLIASGGQSFGPEVVRELSNQVQQAAQADGKEKARHTHHHTQRSRHQALSVVEEPDN